MNWVNSFSLKVFQSVSNRVVSFYVVEVVVVTLGYTYSSTPSFMIFLTMGYNPSNAAPSNLEWENTEIDYIINYENEYSQWRDRQ